jgi:thiamine pyrophosphokinase
MSSHHIVREKQEPALLILSIEAFEEEYLGQLLEWSPTVIVYAAIYDHIFSMGIKIDAIITDDLIPQNLQEHVKIIHLNEEDIISSALKYLVAENYPSVNIITEKFIAKDYLFFVEYLDIVIFAEGKKIFPIKSGFTKWKPKGDDVFVLLDESSISYSGLSLVSPHHYLTEKDGFYGFTFNQPFIFIAEKL